MTITEAPPETADVAPATHPAEPSAALYNLVSTGDHKAIGAQYTRVALLFGAIFTIVGVVIGLERVDPAAIDIYNSYDQFEQAWQGYAVGLVFLVLVPLFVGIGASVVPLQVGSPAIAFPRALAASFWGWLIGSGIWLAAMISDGGFGTSAGLADRDPVLLTLVGFALVLGSLALAAVCLATTVIALRPAGMALHRVPVFSWSMLVASVIWLLSLGALLANLAVIYVDNRYGQTALGQQPNIWGQLQWAFTGPQAFAWVIPVLGVAGETVPVATRLRQKNYPVLLGAIAAFGLLSFTAYAQAFFSTGELAVTEQALFVGQSFVVVLPVLVLLGGLADTIRLGGRQIGVPRPWLVASVLALVILLVGVALTAVRAVDEFSLVGTSADAATLHIAIGAGLLAATGALAFWIPKLMGRRLSPLTMLGALALAGGALVSGIPDFLSGLLDQPFLAGEGYTPDDGVEALNIVSMIGSVLLAVGVVAVLLDVLRVTVQGVADDADADPWGGHTLEWSTTSPPPPTNFAAPVAAVRSERPMLDAPDDESSEAADDEEEEG